MENVDEKGKLIYEVPNDMPIDEAFKFAEKKGEGFKKKVSKDKILNDAINDLIKSQIEKAVQ